MTTITFTVDTPPVTWKRAGRNGRQSYTDLAAATAQEEIGWRFLAASRWTQPTADRFHVTIDVFTKTRTRSDLDNYAKNVLDALEGHAWINDSQVDELTVRRHHRPADPGWHITIETRP